jgi:hypothetical protein
MVSAMGSTTPPTWVRPIAGRTTTRRPIFRDLARCHTPPWSRTTAPASAQPSAGRSCPKNLLGKKWYFFFDYEGSRFPNSGNTEFTVPSALFRAGIIQLPDASGKYIAYNLNPGPVTVGGVTYPAAVCPNGACDPRGLGLNPLVNQIWSKFMPMPNDPTYGDQYNTQGWIASLRAPLTQNNYVGRMDHEFNDKWRWMGSYRYSKSLI